MTMRETDYGGSVPVEGYGPGFFRVGGTVTHGPVIVTGRGVLPWGGLEDSISLLDLAGQIDVLFLGMGDANSAVPKVFAEALDRAGLAVEPMATPTAARSYNVTLAEGRRVACALLPV